MSRHRSSAEVPSLTTISVTGVSFCPYDTVYYNCSISTDGEDGPAAEAKAAPIVASLRKLLEQLKAKGVKIDDCATKVTPNIQPQWDHHSRPARIAGYTATYAVRVKSESVDRHSEVFAALTKLKGVGIQPELRVKDLTEQHDKAYDDAVLKLDAAYAQFAKKIRLRNPADYDIANCVTDNDRSQSAGLRAAAAAAYESAPSGGGEPIQLDTGLATITVTLTATYAHVSYLGGHRTTSPAKPSKRKGRKTGAAELATDESVGQAEGRRLRSGSSIKPTSAATNGGAS